MYLGFPEHIRPGFWHLIAPEVEETQRKNSHPGSSKKYSGFAQGFFRTIQKEERGRLWVHMDNHEGPQIALKHREL